MKSTSPPPLLPPPPPPPPSPPPPPLPPLLHRLAAQLADLEATIKQKQQENTRQEDQLASLRPTLERLKQATQPVQEFFKMPLDWEKEQHTMALLLPP